MLVADTSSLVSIGTVDLLATALSEFDVHTTERVLDELRETSDYGDRHGEAATTVLDHREKLTVHTAGETVESSRIDSGEGSCAVLADDLGADFLLIDDLRALPELQQATAAQIAISPILLRALVERGALEEQEASDCLDALAEKRDWLGAPIYRRARRLFED